MYLEKRFFFKSIFKDVTFWLVLNTNLPPTKNIGKIASKKISTTSLYF